MPHPLRLGLIINPYAGLGGPAALKGSDNQQQVIKLLDDDQSLVAIERAVRCLQLLRPYSKQLSFISCEGVMGQTALEKVGLPVEKLIPRVQSVLGDLQSSAKDTFSAAQAMFQQVDLLLFVGGDGTARDIYDALGYSQAVLGIPAGVKMQSGVFALSPEAAGALIIEMLEGRLIDIQSQEVRDIDEQALQQGQVRSRYYGEMCVPQSGRFLQHTKHGGLEVEALVIDDIVADILQRLEDDVIYIVGAGTTTQVLLQQLGLEGSLLGVDILFNQEVVASDISATELEEFLSGHRERAQLIVSVTGNQGALIGRGNQQLSAKVLRHVGREGLWVLASKTKLAGLQGRPLLMDSNDPLLDREWQGFMTVITGYQDAVLYPLGIAELPH